MELKDRYMLVQKCLWIPCIPGVFSIIHADAPSGTSAWLSHYSHQTGLFLTCSPTPRPAPVSFLKIGDLCMGFNHPFHLRHFLWPRSSAACLVWLPHGMKPSDVCERDLPRFSNLVCPCMHHSYLQAYWYNVTISSILIFVKTLGNMWLRRWSSVLCLWVFFYYSVTSGGFW